jgi:hypothetical protein
MQVAELLLKLQGERIAVRLSGQDLAFGEP